MSSQGKKSGLSLGPRLSRHRPSHHSKSNPSHCMMLADQFNESKMFNRWFKFDGIMALVTLTGAMLVGLSIVVIGIIESKVVDQAGAHNRQEAFLRVSEFFGNMAGQTGGIQNLTVLKERIKEIRELRPGIQRLSVFEITPGSSSLVFSTDPKMIPRALDSLERIEIEAGRSVMQLDESSAERAWRITAPVIIDGKVAGALRGLFSVKEYDDLIGQEIALAQKIGIGVVLLTSLAFLMLIRVKVHQPIHRLLYAMRTVEKGDLSGQASVTGPAETQELATQFNRMLDRLREDQVEKDRLMRTIRHFNETLQKRVVEATEELRQANDELVETRLAIEQSQRLASLGELSATVAHELGNPLNALSGHLQMLTYASDSSDRQRHLSIIRSEVDRMVAIIRQLLDQTRMRLQPVAMNLNGIIREVLSLLLPSLPRQHVTLKTDFQADLPPVASDPRALHGLLFNLATNAVQAMPSGGELIIKTRTVCSPELPGTVIVSDGAQVNDTSIRLIIADTGNGIPPEHLTRIFEPFFTTRHDQGGTGLGLAICHRVVTDSGSRLAVKSEVGHGTEITVDMPIWNEGKIWRRQ